jgi:hypothetical protein
MRTEKPQSSNHPPDVIKLPDVIISTLEELQRRGALHEDGEASRFKMYRCVSCVVWFEEGAKHAYVVGYGVL